MKNLSSVSLVLMLLLLLLLLATACTTIRPPGLKKCNKAEQEASLERSPYLDHFDKMLFKASMTIRTERLTGLMLFKKMPDSSLQVVFTNEIGMTFFNFILKDDSFETGYCFDALNKKALIGMFRACFELMLKYKADEEGRLYLCEQLTGNNVVRGKYGRYYTWSGITGDATKTAVINGMTNLSDKTMITFRDFSGDIPKTVTILNPFINLRIHLEMLSF